MVTMHNDPNWFLPVYIFYVCGICLSPHGLYLCISKGAMESPKFLLHRVGQLRKSKNRPLMLVYRCLELIQDCMH
uniref:Uncharacterized protein n=1 Tax=Solanum tuberosum TaxID=4113 RepID=M1A2U4_SOLTU